jgi:hypothetical protein
MPMTPPHPTLTDAHKLLRAELDRCGCTACECPTCHAIVRAQDEITALRASVDHERAAREQAERERDAMRDALRRTEVRELEALADLDEHRAALAETRGKLEAAEAECEARASNLYDLLGWAHMRPHRWLDAFHTIASRLRAGRDAETALRQAQAERDAARAEVARLEQEARSRGCASCNGGVFPGLGWHGCDECGAGKPTPTTDAEESDRDS